ncbi:hypothetical protein AAY473_001822 [Plecturocebus cupreus]
MGPAEPVRPVYSAPGSAVLRRRQNSHAGQKSHAGDPGKPPANKSFRCTENTDTNQRQMFLLPQFNSSRIQSVLREAHFGEKLEEGIARGLSIPKHSLGERHTNDFRAPKSQGFFPIIQLSAQTPPPERGFLGHLTLRQETSGNSEMQFQICGKIIATPESSFVLLHNITEMACFTKPNLDLQHFNFGFNQYNTFGSNLWPQNSLPCVGQKFWALESAPPRDTRMIQGRAENGATQSGALRGHSPRTLRRAGSAAPPNPGRPGDPARGCAAPLPSAAPTRLPHSPAPRTHRPLRRRYLAIPCRRLRSLGRRPGAAQSLQQPGGRSRQGGGRAQPAAASDAAAVSPP